MIGAGEVVYIHTYKLVVEFRILIQIHILAFFFENFFFHILARSIIYRFGFADWFVVRKPMCTCGVSHADANKNIQMH